MKYTNFHLRHQNLKYPHFPLVFLFSLEKKENEYFTISYVRGKTSFPQDIEAKYYP